MPATTQLFYNQGLISTGTGSPANPRLFIGNGTLWAVDGAQLVFPGDTLFLLDQGIQLPIVEITDNTHLVVGIDYTGPALTNVQYLILFTSPQRYQQFALAAAIRAQINRNSVFDSASPVFSIKEFQRFAPVGDEVIEDKFVVGPAPSGEFQGHANEIAERTETGWLFTTPQHGWSVIDETQNMVHLWTGTQWLSAAGLGASIVFVGAWNGSATYSPGQVVTHNDSVWIARTASTNSEPTPLSSDWDEFLQIGADGGAFTLRYSFLTDQSNSDPGTGNIKFNAAPASATIIRISRFDAHGSDWGSLIAAIGTSTTGFIKGKVRIVTKGDLTRQWIANVMSVADVGAPDYYNITVSSPVASVSSLQNAADVLFMFQERGDVGQQGIQGLQGLRGFAGGPIAIDLIADLSTTENSDPGQGKIRFGSIPQNAATVLRVDAKNSFGESIANLLDSLSTASSSLIKASGRLFVRDDPSKYITFKIVAVDSSTDYRNLTITGTDGPVTNPFVTGDNVVLAWIPKGDKGDAGTIAVGSVTTGDPGSAASVTNAGSNQAAVFDFTIPRGDPGDNFQPQHIVSDLSGRNAFDAGPVFDVNGTRLSVLVLSDSSNGNNPTLYFLLTAANDPDPAIWSTGITFGQVATTAADISFDDTNTGIGATNVQTAIAIIAADISGALVFKGPWNASVGSFPGGGVAQAGSLYSVSTAGTVNGVSFSVGDFVFATVNNASTTTYANNWLKIEGSLTLAEVQTAVGFTFGSLAALSSITASLISDASANGRSLIQAANFAAMRTLLGLGTAALLNVGTGPNNIVQLDGSSRLPAVDASQLTNLPSASAGRLIDRNVFTSSQTITIPTGATKGIVKLVGGGGGGGRPGTGAGGGGAGGCVDAFLTGLTPGNTLNLTIGAAGLGRTSTAGNGTAGGNSSLASGSQTITTLTANGGQGGSSSAFTLAAGGSATGGNVNNITGSSGGSIAFSAPCIQETLISSGGSNPHGVGGQLISNLNTAGVAGTGFGAGGSGASGTANGANGTAGGCIIEWYS